MVGRRSRCSLVPPYFACIHVFDTKIFQGVGKMNFIPMIELASFNHFASVETLAHIGPGASSTVL